MDTMNIEQKGLLKKQLEKSLSDIKEELSDLRGCSFNKAVDRRWELNGQRAAVFKEANLHYIELSL